jgi:hypothetical protein
MNRPVIPRIALGALLAAPGTHAQGRFMNRPVIPRIALGVMHESPLVFPSFPGDAGNS